jgi:hypothetical protein
MNSATLFRSIACMLASVFCLTASGASAAETVPPSNEIAALKADLAHAEDKLEMALRSYTLATQENDTLKAQAAQAAAAESRAMALARKPRRSSPPGCRGGLLIDVFS